MEFSIITRLLSPGDRHRRHVPVHVRVGDARAAQAPRQRDGRARGLRVRPAVQLAPRRQRAPLAHRLHLLLRHRLLLHITQPLPQPTPPLRVPRDTPRGERQQESGGDPPPYPRQTHRPRLPPHRPGGQRAQTSGPPHQASHQQREPVPMLHWLVPVLVI